MLRGPRRRGRRRREECCCVVTLAEDASFVLVVSDESWSGEMEMGVLSNGVRLAGKDNTDGNEGFSSKGTADKADVCFVFLWAGWLSWQRHGLGQTASPLHLIKSFSSRTGTFCESALTRRFRSVVRRTTSRKSTCVEDSLAALSSLGRLLSRLAALIRILSSLVIWSAWSSSTMKFVEFKMDPLVVMQLQ